MIDRPTQAKGAAVALFRVILTAALILTGGLLGLAFVQANAGVLLPIVDALRKALAS